jgi:hypothetical protein
LVESYDGRDGLAGAYSGGVRSSSFCADRVNSSPDL